ncbi:transglycosylase SLT domain-containing protein [Vibrio sp. JC009]|uniref:transglycosylase SLT domain-containing protein n=1 Tax=Vibrio sp. JC009 TaxID=2912314 RepID=UPI0023B09AE2|nr:transglycosylase SLT domain-containing protein [Vibrio sp. JC009]WED22283.1 transglycosylase SLT domain-containing protein [Vibrio sp. JC009]
MQRLVKLAAVILPVMAISSGAYSAPASLAQQRLIYKKAQNYLDKKQVEEYMEIRDQIADYPLTPYVDYRTFLIGIGDRSPEEVNSFVQRHKSFPFSNKVRAAYLDALIKEGKWKTFYRYQTYEPKMEKYKCSYYYAHFRNGAKDKAFKGAEKLWLSGKSVSENCDLLFEEWKNAGLRTDDLVLRRMLLSYESNSNSMVTYLAKMTESNKSRLQAKEMKKLAQDPKYVMEFAQKYPPSDFNRRQSEVALRKLARSDIRYAHSLLPLILEAQNFQPEQAQKLSEYFANRLINTDVNYLAGWRDAVLQKSSNTKVLESRIRLAIRQADWPMMSFWISRLPEKARDSMRWQYWLARSEMALGDNDAGIKRMQSLLGKRNFYSAAAAKSLDKPVSYISNNAQADTDILKPYEESLARIKEMIDVNKITAAKSEWIWLLWQVGAEEKKALAVYAAEKDWYHLTVKATIEARMWDATALRFPIAHQWWFNFYGDKHGVDPITLMSVARQESALDARARSPVGARGIMQIMPRTAKYTAKKFKLSYNGASQLYDVGKNIEIGSHYLNSLLEQYENNRVFAFAAYNAGPHRVKTWRERTKGNVDVFAFIEAIPFKETRGYVQNILMFETYYRNLMQVEGDFLKQSELLAKY